MTTSTTPSTIQSLAQGITSTPGVCGGRPCIAGTRIKVIDIYVLHELEGKTPDQIVDDYPQLSLGDVHAALSYYFHHRLEIEQDYQAEDKVLAEMKAKLGSGPLEERNRLVKAGP